MFDDSGLPEKAAQSVPLSGAASGVSEDMSSLAQ